MGSSTLESDFFYASIKKKLENVTRKENLCDFKHPEGNKKLIKMFLLRLINYKMWIFENTFENEGSNP